METKSKKVATKSTTKSTAKAKAEATVQVSVSPVHEKMNKLETAYMAAISGKMKFGKVKSIFKQLHKEIKKSVKSKN